MVCVPPILPCCVEPIRAESISTQLEVYIRASPASGGGGTTVTQLVQYDAAGWLSKLALPSRWFGCSLIKGLPTLHMQSSYVDPPRLPPPSPLYTFAAMVSVSTASSTAPAAHDTAEAGDAGSTWLPLPRGEPIRAVWLADSEGPSSDAALPASTETVDDAGDVAPRCAALCRRAWSSLTCELERLVHGEKTVCWRPTHRGSLQGLCDVVSVFATNARALSPRASPLSCSSVDTADEAGPATFRLLVNARIPWRGNRVIQLAVILAVDSERAKRQPQAMFALQELVNENEGQQHLRFCLTPAVVQGGIALKHAVARGGTLQLADCQQQGHSKVVSDNKLELILDLSPQSCSSFADGDDGSVGQDDGRAATPDAWRQLLAAATAGGGSPSRLRLSLFLLPLAADAAGPAAEDRADHPSSAPLHPVDLGLSTALLIGEVDLELPALIAALEYSG